MWPPCGAASSFEHAARAKSSASVKTATFTKYDVLLLGLVSSWSQLVPGFLVCRVSVTSRQDHRSENDIEYH